jgi:hypothetical protein
MTSRAVNVTAEVEPVSVVVSWEEQTITPPYEGDVATWVIQDVLHPAAPLQVVSGDARRAEVLSPRCEWSVYVLYQVVVRDGGDSVLRSEVSEPSKAVYVSCNGPYVYKGCTASVTFARHGAPYHKP